MDAIRLAVLVALIPSLGGCMAPTAATWSNLPPPVLATAAITEPGSSLRPGLHGARGGVDPYAELQASERERTVWTPIEPGRISRPVSLVGSDISRRPGDPPSTASLPAANRPYDGEDVLNRLEQDGQRIAKPICAAC